GIALAEDGNDTFCHYAAAVVRRAERRLDDAWEHCLVALGEDDDVDALVIGASIQQLRGLYEDARELVARARAKDPHHPGALRQSARIDYETGRFDDAATSIEQALRAGPDELDTHVLAGRIALARGQAAEADGHLQVALAAAPDDPDVLALLVAIKARRSWA